MSQFFVGVNSNNLPPGADETLTGNFGKATASANNINVVTANSTVIFSGSASNLTQDFGLSNLILGDNPSEITSAVDNVGLGLGALPSISSGGANVAIGVDSLNALTTGNNNTAIGEGTAPLLTSSSGNVAIGTGCLSGFTTGSAGSGSNVSIGSASLAQLSTGIFNIALGYQSGDNYTTSESSNIIIGNLGVIGESNTTRIGTQGSASGNVNRCFIAGIEGVSVTNKNIVTINTNTGQLGSDAILSPAQGGTGVSNTGTITLGGNFKTLGAFASTFTMTNTTGVTFPTSGTLATTSQLPTLPLTVANGGTGLATLTAHSLQVGAGTSTITQLGVGSTGTVLIGSTGADPVFSATPTVTSISFGGTALSVYSEGTWTPTIVGGSVAGVTTYATQQGYYTRIGNLITLFGYLSITGATGTGNATITSLPFTVKSQSNYFAPGTISGDFSGFVWPVGGSSPTLVALENTTTAIIETVRSIGSNQAVQMANGTLAVWFTVSYQI